MPDTNPPSNAGDKLEVPDRAGDPHTADWRSGLGPEERRIAEKFLSPEDVIRSYGELERRLGRSIIVPDADADQPEWDKFYDRLGRPARPEEYGVTLPADIPEHLAPGEADKARLDGFLASMHAAGAAPSIVQAAIDWYYGELASVDRQRHVKADATAADAEANLRREWRGDYERNVGYARQAIIRFGDEGLAALLDQAGIGRAPAVIRAFARIGRAISEDDAAVHASPADASGRLGDELDALRRRPDYWSSDTVQKRAREISVALYGEQPAHAGI